MVAIRNLAQVGAALTAVSPRAQNVTDDTAFYGQSPPVYPSPNGQGVGKWEPAYAKARAFVAQMTLEEKVNITRGYTITDNACAGNTGSIPRLNWAGLCLHDAGNGVRATDFVNSYPSGISAGASWDKNLTYHRAYEMGLEFRKKGINVLLGPMVGPLGRVPTAGRNWEGFSVDPYLSGILVAETIKGYQDAGVIASLKHFIANEQETHRTKYNDTEAVSSNLDDKTLHELYLWPFMDGVRAGTASVMTSYNRINNSYASQNSKLVNGVLKADLEFPGFVVSDWTGQWSGVASALAGLDMTMPRGGFWGNNLTEAVNNGSVPLSRVDDMVTRILAAWYFTGQDNGFPENGIGMRNLTQPHEIVDARRPESVPVLLDGAAGGHVLVKNINNALPLKDPKMLSLFGYDAIPPPTKNTDRLFQLGYNSQPEMSVPNLGNEAHFSQYAMKGTIVTGGRAGANAPAYIKAPYDAITHKAAKTGIFLNWDFSSAEPPVNPVSAACLVFINAMATEGWDREGLHDDFSDGLVKHVASQCSNTIVVIHNAGVRLVDQWIEHENVTAVIFAHLPGQDSGEALVRLLWGHEDAAVHWGKLPYSIPKNESDYNVYRPDVSDQNNRYPQSDFTEGVYIDYREFDRRNTELRYEFGFGLSYSEFEYSGLDVRGPKSSISATGTADDLWETVASVQAVIANVGKTEAAEISQLYIGIPESPLKQLRGFEKTFLIPEANATVNFDLTRRDLSIWDVETQDWVIQKGRYNVTVGASSKDLRLVGDFTI